MIDREYEDIYESIKFSEKEGDPFSSASVKRKCLALNFHASVKLEDNFTTSYLLTRDLQEYSKIVDNQDKDAVNNYSELTLALLAQNRCENQKHWKTNLHNYNIKDFVKPLPCRSSTNNYLCKEAKITKSSINEFQNARLHYQLPEETEFQAKEVKTFLSQDVNGFNKTNPQESEISFNNASSIKDNQSGFKFTPKESQLDFRFGSRNKQSGFKQSHESSEDPNSYFPSIANQNYFTNTSRKDDRPMQEREIRNEHRFIQPKAPVQAQRKYGGYNSENRRNTTEKPDNFERFGSSSAGNSDNSRRFNNYNNYNSNNNSNNYNNDNNYNRQNQFSNNRQERPENLEDDDHNPKGHSFKTARDLYAQNSKKFGRGGGSGSGSYNAGNNYNSYGSYGPNSSNSSNEGSYNYGTGKKTLGARKNSVFNKFTPPLRRNDQEEEQEPLVDERLKNIDPKMIELIKNEIMDIGSRVTWDDIAGLELAKSTIQEIVVYPMLRPDIFTGLRRPPKGILLFGPPGTGKTLIGKCIASQSNSTFFSISASSLTSKWVGEGEKMVRALFAVAHCHQPAVVFIDEIDSLLSQRSDSEHESSRRMKTEFLVQLDGAGTGDDERILIIGATNRPQELDEAARRRLVKRLYIPLPDESARRQIIENLISTERHCLSDLDISEISNLTKGYSGADVKNLCQEASLGPIRSIPPMQIRDIRPEQVRPLNASDFKLALTRIKSSVSEGDLGTYIAWDRQYGCGSAMN